MTVEPTSLIVCLHGLGADGGQFHGVRDALHAALPRTTVVTPDAPDVADAGTGHQWFSLSGITDENRSARLAEARIGLDGLLTREIARHGFADRLDRIVLLGFSQGAVMALDAVASGSWPVKAVVSFAGRLVTPDPLTPQPGLRALLIHGQADPVILPHCTDQACARLRIRGVSVERHMLPQVGHAMTPEAVEIGLRFLSSVLGH